LDRRSRTSGRIRAMNVTLLGDHIITNDVLKAALQEAFAESSIEFEYEYYTGGWPLEPIQHNDEIREFIGDDNEIVPKVTRAEIILTQSCPVSRKVIDAARHLKVVGAARGGPVNVNAQACTERGIPVLYSPGSHADAVAEFTLGLILAHTRNIARAHTSMVRDKRWRGDLYTYEACSPELRYSVVGVVGFGGIGAKVAELCRCFGARTLVSDPYVLAETIREAGHEAVSLDELLGESDIVSLHARLNDDTRGMLGEPEFGLMKPTAILVNTARGGLVQEAALWRVLEEKRIAGAALDVFAVEPPPPDSPVYGLDNVTLTSHLAGASVQGAELGAKAVTREVYRFISGTEKPELCVNPEVLKRKPL
jgi:D-3-phosphoglycerate dehydrogenase